MEEIKQLKVKRSRKHKSIGDRVFDFTNYTLLTALTLVCFYPILHILFASVSDPGALVAHRGYYSNRWDSRSTVTSWCLKTTACSGIPKYDHLCWTGHVGQYGHDDIGRLRAVQAGLVFQELHHGHDYDHDVLWRRADSWFLLMKDIGLYNNLWAMILPTALSTWNIIILRTGFQSIPRELEEAALIDGASQANILITVILPLSKATLAVIFLYYLVGNWNSWFNAMVLLKDRNCSRYSC